MDSLIYFGQFIRHHRLRNGMTQKELSLKIFNKENESYVGKLERGTLEGITFSTVHKILMVLTLKGCLRNCQPMYQSCIENIDNCIGNMGSIYVNKGLKHKLLSAFRLGIRRIKY